MTDEPVWPPPFEVDGIVYDRIAAVEERESVNVRRFFTLIDDHYEYCSCQEQDATIGAQYRSLPVTPAEERVWLSTGVEPWMLIR